MNRHTDQPTAQHTDRPTGRLGISVPPTWRRRSDPDRGVLVEARSARLPPSGVRPELVLRCTYVDTDLATWREQAMAELAMHLVDFALEDDDDYDLLDRPVAYRRFAHRLGAVDVLCEQWAWLSDHLGVTLTCTVAREEYADYADVFEQVAATLEGLPEAG